jgi:hypothetical protein
VEINSVLNLLEAKQYNLECPKCIKEINYAFVCDLMSDALMLLKQMPSHIGARSCNWFSYQSSIKNRRNFRS